MAMVCHLPGCDGIDLPGSTIRDFLAHQRTVHLNVDLTGPGQDWHEALHNEIRRITKTGKTFQLWEIFAVVGDPPNHKHANGGITQEIEHLGLAHVVGYEPSGRPGSKKSAVAVWRGGPKPKENAAA